MDLNNLQSTNIFSPSSLFGQYETDVLNSALVAAASASEQAEQHQVVQQTQPSFSHQQLTGIQRHIASLSSPQTNVVRAVSTNQSRSGQATSHRSKYAHSAINGGMVSDQQQQLYYKKWKRLKKTMKNLVFINAAICDEVVRIDEKVHKAKEERRFLLRKVMQHQTVKTESPGTSTKVPSISISAIKQLPTLHSLPSSTSIITECSKPKPKRKAPATGEKKRNPKDALDPTQHKPRKSKQSGGKRTVPPIPLDPMGRPILPVAMGDLTIHSLGEVVADRPAFHCGETIYPVGFCSTRIYASLSNLTEKCLYTCKISDAGLGPIFEISPEDSSGQIFRSSISPTDCHSHLLRGINISRGMELVDIKGSGSEFFGLTHPVTQHLVQSCPGAKKCSNYKWVKFEISKLDTLESYVEVSSLDPTVSYSALTENILQGHSPSRGGLPADLTSLRSLLTGGIMKFQ